MKPTLPLFALLGACATVPAAPAGPTAALAEVASAGPLLIRPLAVVEDSRCPADVHCVWAGRLVLRAEIEGRSGRATRDLTLGEPLAIEGGRLLLAAATPAKSASDGARPLAYRFTFSFAR